MIDSQTESLLRLEKVCTVGMSVPAVGRSLFLSLNPDLVDDFGHFLNYEKRIRGLCAEVGMAYRCLANRRLSITDPELLPTFEQDSGHFALVRRDAAGREAAIAGQLADVIRDSIREMERGGVFDNIFVFLYCGSSVLASRLAEFGWEPRIRICVNAFWDFLLADTHYRHLAVMPFQRQVRLLAMSDLHRDEMLDASGLSFSSIPNPPPLLSDTQSYDAIHAQAGKVWRRGSVQVLIPGLMTLGKGGDATRSLLERVRVGDGSPSRFVFRDRKCVLGADAPPSLSIITGDLTDDDVAELYRASDFAVLPYEPITFGVRTSGALVDCLVFGVVPLVMQGTWLAHVCREFDFGCVLPNMEPDTVLRTLRQSSVDLPAERARVIQAAGRYLAQHHWRRLFELVTHTSDGGPPAPEQGAPLREASPLAVANRLYRDGRFNEAARVYAWLKQGSPLPIYERNLRMCESHVSQ